MAFATRQQEVSVTHFNSDAVMLNSAAALCKCRGMEKSCCFVQDTWLVAPEKGNEEACTAVTALCSALSSQQIALLARFVPRANGEVNLCILTPYDSNSNTDCFVMNSIPYEADIRAASFTTFAKKPEVLPTKQQLSLMDGIVDAHILDSGDILWRPLYRVQRKGQPHASQGCQDPSRPWPTKLWFSARFANSQQHFPLCSSRLSGSPQSIGQQQLLTSCSRASHLRWPEYAGDMEQCAPEAMSNPSLHVFLRDMTLRALDSREANKFDDTYISDVLDGSLGSTKESRSALEEVKGSFAMREKPQPSPKNKKKDDDWVVNSVICRLMRLALSAAVWPVWGWECHKVFMHGPYSRICR